jgi:hypothetical protein
MPAADVAFVYTDQLAANAGSLESWRGSSWSGSREAHPAKVGPSSSHHGARAARPPREEDGRKLQQQVSVRGDCWSEVTGPNRFAPIPLRLRAPVARKSLRHVSNRVGAALPSIFVRPKTPRVIRLAGFSPSQPGRRFALRRCDSRGSAPRKHAGGADEKTHAQQRSRHDPIPQRGRMNKLVAIYEQPVTWRAVWQVCNTMGPLRPAWFAMYRTLSISGGSRCSGRARGRLSSVVFIFHGLWARLVLRFPPRERHHGLRRGAASRCSLLPLSAGSTRCTTAHRQPRPPRWGDAGR